MPFTLPWWLKRGPQFAVETVVQVEVPSVTYLGEQDGPVERTMKARWLPILSMRPEIRRAFLVKASYKGQSDVHVVLALSSTSAPDRRLIDELRVPHAALFSRDCALDMMFLKPAEESDVEKVCRPFYAAV